MNVNESFKNIDEYIALFHGEIKEKLILMRETIKKAAPQATETISYQIPTFKLKKNLVHFAAYNNHIGFYPTPSAIAKYKEEIANYKWAKGSVQFPVDKPLPLELVEKMVRFRVAEENSRSK
ncbi:MAG: DUF1801 domain-containing protein [Bacteroidales bacterium]